MEHCQFHHLFGLLTKLAVKTSHAAKLFNAVQKAQVSWQRIKPLLQQAAPEEDEQPLGPVEPADLEVRDLACHYPGQEEGLAGISFSAHPGDIIGITGPVACGKSLLGKVFLDEVPWTGTLLCHGEDFHTLDRERRRSLVPIWATIRSSSALPLGRTSPWEIRWMWKNTWP